MYNFNNGNFNNYQGMNYGYARPNLPNPTNPLTKEEMATLKQKAPQFTLAVDQVTALKAICTHRDQNGDTLLSNPDGTATCTICGTTFRPVNATVEDVAQIFQSAIDCLETMKIMYLDIPNDVTKGYFQMIPFLEKAPQLYKIALDHYSRYGNTSVMGRDYNANGNAFALYNALMNPAAMMMGMQQNMPYGQQQVQPGAMQQQPPVPDVTMGATQGVNPFDSASPAMSATKTTDNKQFSL